MFFTDLFIASSSTSSVTYQQIDNIVATTTIYPDSNELNCTVQYDIVGIPAPTQEVDVLLFPAKV